MLVDELNLFLFDWGIDSNVQDTTCILKYPYIYYNDNKLEKFQLII